MLNEIDLSRTDLNLLVLFEVVFRELHVGRAAKELNLSASAVSHGLGRLRRLLNDPLFLRTPKGVVATARATELAEPIGEILARVRSVVATAEPFDPARSRRRFVIGAPDGISAVFLSPLMAELASAAPGIDISARHLLQTALAELEARTIDIAIVPLDDIPARFSQRVVYEEDFVIAMRAGHPYGSEPTLERYCEMHHVIISLTGDVHAYVDEVLARHGRSRRVALAAPNFMLALAMIGETEMIAALPRSFVAMHGPRFGVTSVEPPVPLRRFQIRAVAPRVALMDAGLAWLFDRLVRVVSEADVHRLPQAAS